MDTPLFPDIDLHLRSYGAERAPDRHAYAQLVLPVGGALLIKIEGRESRLDPLHGACVALGARHTQCGQGRNHSLILDVGAAALRHGRWDRVFERPFPALGAGARKLVDFMYGMHASGTIAPAILQGWAPLLLDTLALDAPQPVSRLASLLARVEAAPGLPWTTAAMAEAAGLSVSRLHALFRSELDASPHAWLLAVRLQRAQDWLAEDARTIADVALAAGFSDQSALTRALRAATGQTPAAYRRAARAARAAPTLPRQESAPKTQ